MKQQKNEKKKLALWLLFLATIGLGLGYAYLTEQLKINSTVEYDSIKWNVGFTEAKDGGGSITSVSSLSNDKKTISITCNVGTSTNSETCITKATIKNDSTFNIELYEDPIITKNDTYIESVDITWSDNESTVKQADTIGIGLSKEVTITITTKNLSEDLLPEQELDIPITITTNWVEASGINRVSYELFPELEESFRATTPATNVVNSISPFYYQNTTLFENKNITQISMYISTVSYVNNYAIMTIRTIKAPESFVVNNAIPNNYLETYTIKIPSEFFNGATTISKWVDINLTKYAYKSDGTIASKGIEVGTGETLAISSTSDTITWSVGTGSLATQPFYYSNNGKIAQSPDNGLYFLFKYEKNVQNVNKEVALSELLTGKKLSVLGDSISTYKGISNNNTYNSTLSSNATYYGNISYTSSVSQDETYWQQIIDRFGMELNVNNSYSGGTVTGINSTNKATNRASQLHNTQNVNPDIIIVYVGINDLRYNQTAANFQSGYTTMLNTIKSNYSNAKVFCIGMPNRNGNDYENGEYTDAEAIEFNTAIQNAISSVAGNFYYVDLFNSEYSDQVYFDNSINTGTQNQYTNSTLDNLHPNEIGMDYITDLIINTMYDALI